MVTVEIQQGMSASKHSLWAQTHETSLTIRFPVFQAASATVGCSDRDFVMHSRMTTIIHTNRKVCTLVMRAGDIYSMLRLVTCLSNE